MSVKDRLKIFIKEQNLTVSGFEEKIKASNGYVNSIHKSIGVDKIESVLEYFPKLNIDWLLTGRGSMILDHNKAPVNHIKQVPFIPISTFAGYGSGSVSIMKHEVEQYYVVPGMQNADFMIKVDGTSMQPNYLQDDIVACKFVQELEQIKWDKVYVLHHKDKGAIVKRLFPADKEDYYRCHSDNPKYPPFDIRINEVTNIAMVIGLIRLEYSDIL